MSLEKFLNIIDRTAVGAAVERRKELIEKTDPKRIYVENIRSFFHFPRWLAKALLELAVRQGALEKRVGIICPNDDRLIADFAPGEEPADIHCIVCEMKGEDQSTFDLPRCKKMEFYRTKDQH